MTKAQIIELEDRAIAEAKTRVEEDSETTRLLLVITSPLAAAVVWAAVAALTGNYLF